MMRQPYVRFGLCLVGIALLWRINGPRESFADPGARERPSGNERQAEALLNSILDARHSASVYAKSQRSSRFPPLEKIRLPLNQQLEKNAGPNTESPSAVRGPLESGVWNWLRLFALGGAELPRHQEILLRYLSWETIGDSVKRLQDLYPKTSNRVRVVQMTTPDRIRQMWIFDNNSWPPHHLSIANSQGRFTAVISAFKNRRAALQFSGQGTEHAPYAIRLSRREKIFHDRQELWGPKQFLHIHRVGLMLKENP